MCFLRFSTIYIWFFVDTNNPLVYFFYIMIENRIRNTDKIKKGFIYD